MTQPSSVTRTMHKNKAQHAVDQQYSKNGLGSLDTHISGTQIGENPMYIRPQPVTSVTSSTVW